MAKLFGSSVPPSGRQLFELENRSRRREVSTKMSPSRGCVLHTSGVRRSGAASCQRFRLWPALPLQGTLLGPGLVAHEHIKYAGCWELEDRFTEYVGHAERPTVCPAKICDRYIMLTAACPSPAGHCCRKCRKLNVDIEWYWAIPLFSWVQIQEPTVSNSIAPSGSRPWKQWTCGNLSMSFHKTPAIWKKMRKSNWVHLFSILGGLQLLEIRDRDQDYRSWAIFASLC